MPFIPQHGHILDVGCGSGRDSKAFITRGYQVTAMDVSPKMVEMASQHIGQAVLLQDAKTLNAHETFDGIWACASLLHIPEKELPDVFHRLSSALKPKGVIYLSFKQGPGEQVEGGRWFTDMTEDRLSACIASVPLLSIHSTWLTADLRPNRQEHWLNAILKRQ